MSTPDAAPVEVEGGRPEVELFTPQTRENLIAAMAKIAAIDDVLGGTEVSTQAHLSSTSMTFRFAKRAPSIEDSLSFATVIEQSPGKLYDAIRRLLAADDEIRRLRALPAAPTTPDIADERVRGMLREAQEFVDAHCADDLSRRIDVALAHCPVCDAEDGPDRDCPTHGKAEGVREP